MEAMRVVFPGIAPITPPASPASAMFISLSTGGYSITHPIGRLLSLVAIVAGLLIVGWGRTHSTFFQSPGLLDMSFWVQVNPKDGMPVSICRSLSRLLSYSKVTDLLSSPRLVVNPLNCVNLRACSLSVMCPLSPDGPGLLGVLLEG